MRLIILHAASCMPNADVLLSVAQPEAVDAVLRLFYTATADGSTGGAASVQTFSRSPEKKTLMMHYALVLALHVESFTMAPEQVRSFADIAVAADYHSSPWMSCYLLLDPVPRAADIIRRGS